MARKENTGDILHQYCAGPKIIRRGMIMMQNNRSKMRLVLCSKDFMLQN